MSRITQPLCQVRLTNVAVVNLKTHGKRFEICCYRNKVMNWRSGLEGDFDEVLQTTSIFQNVSKGRFANRDDIQKVFGTTDESVICRIILEKGELQVSDKERNVIMDALFRDVCTIVASKCVNPRTGLSLTVNMVERSLKECGFAVKWGVNAKKLALRGIELLRKEMPHLITRAPLLMRIACDASLREVVRNYLVECRAVIEHEGFFALSEAQDGSDEPVLDSSTRPESQNSDGSVEQISQKDHLASHSLIKDLSEQLHDFDLDVKSKVKNSEAEGTEQQHAGREEPLKVTSSASAIGNNTVCPVGQGSVEFQFLCDPSYYRQLDHFVSEDLQPAGSLQLISSSAERYGGTTVEHQIVDSTCIPRTVEVVDSNTAALLRDENRVKLDESTAVDCSPTGKEQEELFGGNKTPAEGPSVSGYAHEKYLNNYGTDDSSNNNNINNPSMTKVTMLEDNTVEKQVRSGVPSLTKINPEAITCSCCKEILDGTKAYRTHCRSELHQFNLKRKVRGLNPIGQVEFDELNDDIRRGFLAVEC